MPRVTLITGHYWDTKRKAGFHWLADAYRNLGFDVLFFSAPISYLLKLKGDYRFDYDLKKEAGKVIKKEENVYSYVHFTPWHVANLRNPLLNKLSTPFSGLYSKHKFADAEEFVKSSDIIIFESTPALFLFKKLKKINPKAKYIYRVSDDIRLLNVHPALISLEEDILEDFDLVSVPSSYIEKTLTPFIKNKNKLQLLLHGINKKMFNEGAKSPYESGINAIFVGNSHFDYSFLDIASSSFPDITFHIIGPIPNIQSKPNVITYGEIPFKDTVPYIKHADIGLQVRSYSTGAESLTDSLKVLQYTYNKLPIVAPDFLQTSRSNTFCYKPGDELSIRIAVKKALSFEMENFDNSQVKSWEEVAKSL